MSSVGNLQDYRHGTSEVVEELEEEQRPQLDTIKENVGGRSSFPYDFDGLSEDCVYVAVGIKGESSVDALSWALRNEVDRPSSTTVCLIHVFQETHFVPSPLGNLPISGVSEQQAEAHKAQERAKRSEQLQKYLMACGAAKVKVDTILIESDGLANAILELIPVLNIKKIVMGTNKSNLRKLRSKKGTGITNQILRKVPDTCEIKVICEGRVAAMDQMPESPHPPPQLHKSSEEPRPHYEQHHTKDYFSCNCFKPKNN
ncbi:hypothetical protein MLD38_019451 [Melastoma candidum]|uniref:Uncharacterized protein n=1 Tax=Melastoma candidum TaxID=119954 RepID=A0ACB9QX44_9MYRT|nr:hypothetical protein MLD38_019451 [Melastoma candidum]